MAPSLVALLAGLACVGSVAAQLSGTVGPTTSRASKAAKKRCNIMDYGGVASATTDNGEAINAAWKACAAVGGEVYIPEGDYGLGTWLTLSGSSMSFCLDGIIHRTGTAGGNMFMFKHITDFELYSSTSKGAIQGYGYEYHKDNTYGARILRFADVHDFSVHDISLVDSPAFHYSIDTCTNGEVYNMVIHGGNRGGLDGIDVWGTNIWIHDVEVSNKDECVTVKNPSDHLLIENIFCNWSGGCAMGSLATGTDIHDIEYTNVYTHNSNQMFMFKSNGGSGTVSNVALNNFIGHSNAYTLDLDAAWSSMSTVDGDGILYSNFTFSGWSGTCANGVQRGPIKFNCPADVPCADMVVKDFSVWTDSGSKVQYVCHNAYGEGACLASGAATATHTSTQTITTSGAYSTQTMPGELTAGLGLTQSIAIPTIPSSFFPGKAPYSPLMGSSGGSSTAAQEQELSTSSASPAASTGAATTSATATAVASEDPTFVTLSSDVSAAPSSTPSQSKSSASTRPAAPVPSSSASRVSSAPSAVPTKASTSSLEPASTGCGRHGSRHRYNRRSHA
ncbi:unnamed protein product [Clonostachys byssicola]|uniref:Rhamnogalacturonase A n=1 Tax=Clonostachys byssicola TaxID=160290 RepID=A0A9N9UG53_9HYPO|nr:unnamed protein product [Clonostachys byssicola]